MTGNKFRVYVAAFFRDGISHRRDLEPVYGLAMYHWGIWVEPKNSDGEGRLHHVEDHPPMNSSQGLVPGGWKFGLRQSNSQTSQHLIGRIMIGKLPAGMGYDEIEHVLNRVSMPMRSGNENCITWVRAAIQVLQREGPVPWAESFDIIKFMNDAHRVIKRWHSTRGWQYFDNKKSYVARAFP